MRFKSLNTFTAMLILAAAAAVLAAGSTIIAVSAASAANHHSYKRIIISSISASSQQATNSARQGVDARLDTRWSASDDTYPQWIKLDLGTAQVVDNVRFHWYRSRMRDYDYITQTSVDGSNWRRFAAGKRVRYVRVRILSCSASGAWASLRDIRLSTFGKTATPIPAPASGPAAEPSPTPTPASGLPRVAPAAPTTSGAVVLRNVHNVVYNNVTFSGAGSGGADSSGVIQILGSTNKVTFVNCTINRNADGVGNGVKIVDSGAGMHDITFQNCLFKGQPRMGFECIGRGSGNGYQRVDLIDCTFEPQGSEAISYDDDSGTAGNCLVTGNLVMGAGTNRAFSWGQGFEINGVRNMTVTSNTFYRCRSSVWNLTGPSGNCGWNLSDNVIDTSRGTVASSSDANPVCASNVTGGVFARNRITNSIAWAAAYFSGCRNMDWRTTVWSGPNATPHQTGCSGNLF
jgi:hypothetical protein